MQPLTTSGDLSELAGALRTAIDSDLMSREHAAIVWKTYLKITQWDVPKETKREV